MNQHRNFFATFIAVALVFFASLAAAPQSVSAQRAQVNERDARDVLRRLTVSLDNFRVNLDDELSRAQRRAGSGRDQADSEELRDRLDDLQADVSDFQSKLIRRRDSRADVTLILSSAKNVNDRLSGFRLSQRLQRDWSDARQLFDRLANNYGVVWNWNDGTPQYPTNAGNFPNSGGGATVQSFGLTGTYRLDVSRSENASEVADRAISRGNVPNSDQARQDLQSKLEAPERLALEVRGNQVTIASTLAPQVTVTADGRDRTETLSDGRTLRVRTSLRGTQELTISSVGGDNDYTVTFASIENGRAMKVTRRVTTDYLNQTVFVESIYTKTDAVARYDIYNDGGSYSTGGGGGNPPTVTTGRTGEFIVPNGTIITGALDSYITTKATQNNDRFKMTVSAPTEFRGAIIEGYISGLNRSGQVTGRSQLTFNFERITTADGRTYDFAGYLQSVTDAEGKQVKIDAEGTAKGDSQTKETVKRGGIGAGLGAIIGAIAGGGKGAAIGAIIGGSAGAGSVYIQGKEDLELRPGSTITVQASSPIR
jgi:hypothetical protein